MFRQKVKQTTSAGASLSNNNDDDDGKHDTTTTTPKKKKTNIFRLMIRLVLGTVVVVFISLLHWIHPYDHEDVIQFKSDSKKSLAPTKFITIVMPSVVAPERRSTRLSAITKTWGSGARAVFVVHDLEELSKNNETSLSQLQQQVLPNPKQPNKFPQILLVPSNITFDDGVPRLHHVFNVIYEHYLPMVDFYFFVNDHTFVIPEHLCQYLSKASPLEPFYAGHSMKNDKKSIFVSGAAGYILSRRTLSQLVTRWYIDCYNPQHPPPKWIQGNPGILTAQCMEQKLNVPHLDTRDGEERDITTSTKRIRRQHRFHAFPLVRSVTGDVDQWYINKHVGMHEIDSKAFDESYDTSLIKGENCCSEETISFHYVEAKETMALYQVRLQLLQNQLPTDEELQRYLIKTWPSNKKDVGYYSHLLPDVNKDASTFKTIMKVLRKISKESTIARC